MARPRRSESTREALIQVGIQHLSMHGYHGTGIKQILDEVKVPKGSFYNFFTSKEAFVAELIRVYSQQLTDQIQTFFANEGAQMSALERLKAITFYSLTKYENLSFKQTCLIATLSSDIDDSNPLCQAALNQSVARCLDLFSQLIEDAQSQGDITQERDARAMADLYWSCWQGCLLRMRVCVNKEEAHRNMSLLFETLFQP